MALGTDLAIVAKGLKIAGVAELAILFDVRNVNFGKPKADVEIVPDGGALPVAGVDGSRAALWLWSRNTVEAGTMRPEKKLAQ